MQKELPPEVRILGVNRIGADGGNAAICDGRDLPWLQDTRMEQAWERWDVAYRDVIVLDAENRPVAVYNLTERSLAVPAHYAELRAILLGQAP